MFTVCFPWQRGHARAWRASVVCLLLASGWAPAAARAQASESADPFSEGEEEVIVFEELENEPLAPQASSHETLAQRAHLVGELGALAAADIRDEGLAEDVYDVRMRFDLSVEYEQSEKLRFALAGRLDYFWSSPQVGAGTSSAGNAAAGPRNELGAELMAAYVAFTDGRLLHVQVGQQVVTSGRLDVLTVLDPLGVYDTRAGPSLTLDSMRLAQPALRFDFDRGGPVVLQTALVPFYRSHALHTSSDEFPLQVWLGRSSREALHPPGANASLSAEQVAALRDADAPAPTFTKPQAMARLGVRLPWFDLGLMGATALEKQPLYAASPALETYLIDPQAPTLDAVNAELDAGGSPLRSRYPRYYLAGLDAGGGIGDTTLGAEVAYSPARQLYTVSRGRPSVPQPNFTAPPGADARRTHGVPVVQAGLHVDHVVGEWLVLFTELTYARALHQPHDAGRHWLGLDRRRADLILGLSGVVFRLLGGHLRLSLGATAASDRSAFLQPQIEYRLFDALLLLVGGVLAMGQVPTVQPAGGAFNVTLGGLYRRDNNLYVGARWLF